MLTISPWEPHLQYSIVSSSFKSFYWLQFQILENSSNSTFLLYRETMPPQATTEKVNILSLSQNNFQLINFLFWLKFYLFLHFFKNLHRVHQCVLHSSSPVYGDNIDSGCAYYTIPHRILQICIFNFII